MEPAEDPLKGVALRTESLASFLLELRDGFGYDLGTSELLVAQDLMLLLAAQGVDVSEPDEVRRYLRPLVCGTPAEQGDFDAHFARWVGRLFEGGPPPEVAAEDWLTRGLDEVEQAGRRWKQWHALAVLVTVLVGAAGWMLARSARPAYLSVQSEAVAARVYVSALDARLRRDSSMVDRLVGTTPLQRLQLDPGRYRVLLRSPGRSPQDTVVSLIPGRTVRLAARLSGRLFISTEEVLGETAEPFAALLNSEYSRRVYRAINLRDTSTVWVDSLLLAWRRHLIDRNEVVPFFDINDAELEHGDLSRFNLLILPQTLALSDLQVDRINAFMEGGGSVLATGMTGVYREDGSWRGWWPIEEAFGVEYRGAEPQTGVVFRGDTPLTAGGTAGSEYRVSSGFAGVAVRVIEPERATAAMRWAVSEEGRSDDSMAAIYGTYGSGRFVYAGFDRAALEGPAAADLWRNAIAYLRRIPVPWISAWPRDNRAAARLSVSVGDSLSEASDVFDALERLRWPATVFVDPEGIPLTSEFGAGSVLELGSADSGSVGIDFGASTEDVADYVDSDLGRALLLERIGVTEFDRGLISLRYRAGSLADPVPALELLDRRIRAGGIWRARGDSLSDWMRAWSRLEVERLSFADDEVSIRVTNNGNGVVDGATISVILAHPVVAAEIRGRWGLALSQPEPPSYQLAGNGTLLTFPLGGELQPGQDVRFDITLVSNEARSNPTSLADASEHDHESAPDVVTVSAVAGQAAFERAPGVGSAFGASPDLVAVSDSSGNLALVDIASGLTTLSVRPEDVRGDPLLDPPVPSRTFDPVGGWGASLDNVRDLLFSGPTELLVGQWSGEVIRLDPTDGSISPVADLVPWVIDLAEMSGGELLATAPDAASLIVDGVRDTRFGTMMSGRGLSQGLSVSSSDNVIFGWSTGSLLEMTREMVLGTDTRVPEPIPLFSTPITDVSYGKDDWIHASSVGGGVASIAPGGSREIVQPEGGSTVEIVISLQADDPRWLAFAGADSTITLWRPDSDPETTVLRGHSARVVDLALDPGGRLLASASWDQTVRIWDLISGESVATLYGHTAHVWAVDWSPDGTLLASGSRDATVRVWETDWFTIQPSWMSHVEPSVSASGGLFRPVVGPSGTVDFWDLRDRGWETSFRIPGARASALEQTPRATRTVVAGDDGSLRVLHGPHVFNHDGAVFRAAISPDGSEIITAETDSAVTTRYWDGRTGQQVSVGADPGRFMVAYSDDSRVRYATDGYVLEARLREDETLLFEEDLPGLDYLWFRESTGVTYVVSRTDSTMTYVDVSSGGLPVTLQAPNEGFLADFSRRLPRVSPGRTVLYTVSSSGSVLVSWDARTGQRLGRKQDFGGFADIQEKAGQIRIVMGRGSMTDLPEWLDMQSPEILDGRTLASLGTATHGNSLVDYELSLDAGWFAVAHTASSFTPGQILFWDVTGNRLERLGSAITQVDGVLGMELAPAGDLLLSWGEYSAYLWDARTWESVMPRILPTRPDSSLARVQESRLDPALGRVVLADGDGNLRSYSLEDGSPTHAPLIFGGPITDFVLDPTGDVLAWRNGATWEDSSEVALWKRGIPSEKETWMLPASILQTRYLPDLASHLVTTGRYEHLLGESAEYPFMSTSRRFEGPGGLVKWDQYNIVYAFPWTGEIVGRAPPGVNALAVNGDASLIAARTPGAGWNAVLSGRDGIVPIAGDSSHVAVHRDGGRLAVTDGRSVAILEPRLSRLAAVGPAFLNLLWILGLALVVSGAGYGIVRVRLRKKAEKALVREKSAETPIRQRVRLAEYVDRVVPATLIQPLATRMRRRYEVSSSRLAIAATIRETVRHGGFFAPRFQSRLEVPEYVVLIERVSYGDHQARYVDELVTALQRADTVIHRYYHDGDPRVCYPADPTKPPLLLEQLAAQTASHRLLVFGSAHAFFDPVTGKLPKWTEIIDRWSSASIVLAAPEHEWGYRESALRDPDPGVPRLFKNAVGLDRRGIAELSGRDWQMSTNRGPRRYFPQELAQNPRKWLDEVPPPDDEIQRMMAHLEYYLGEDGMAWLRSCAVWPAIEWKLTLCLGGILGKETLGYLSPELALRLSRLPWFRQAYMPDWLMSVLKSGLSREDLEKVTAALGLLSFQGDGNPEDPLAGAIGIGDLEIAVDQRDRVNKLAGWVLRRPGRGRGSEQELREYVFVKYLRDQRSNPLALALPEGLRRFVPDMPADRAGWLVGALGVLLIAAVLWFSLTPRLGSFDEVRVIQMPVVAASAGSSSVNTAPPAEGVTP